MDVQVRVKRNITYNNDIIPAGTVLTLSKKQIEEMGLPVGILVTLEEEERQEKEKSMVIKANSFDHNQMKESYMEQDRIQREIEATVLEKQAEEQARLAKTAAMRLRGKTKEAVPVA